MTATIALFDVDGTLLRAAGAGTRALNTVFAEILGPDASRIDLSCIDFAGRTDPWIVRTALENAGLSTDAELRERLLARYEALLPTELPNSDQFRLCAGAKDAVESLSGTDGLFMGLGTGNLESCAYAKVEHAGYHGHFHFGGFGSDAEDRAELLQVGADRGAAAAGQALSNCRLIVIGDTPHDVAAAHAIGALAIGVSTGVRSLDELREADADLAVETLGDPRVAEFLLGAH